MRFTFLFFKIHTSEEGNQTNSNQVLVKLVATGICHTDVHTKVNGYCKFPAVLGHEGAGIVEHVGGSVRGLSKGDHVVMSYASCGGCAFCHGGKPSYCVSHGDLNFSQHRLDGSKCVDCVGSEPVFGNFFQQSSFATHAVTNHRNVVKIDKDLPLALMAPLGCAVQTGAGMFALKKLPAHFEKKIFCLCLPLEHFFPLGAVLNSFAARPGSSLVVFGCGGVGLSAVMAAKIANCSRILAVDINPERLRIARELGATHSITSSAGVRAINGFVVYVRALGTIVCCCVFVSCVLGVFCAHVWICIFVLCVLLLVQKMHVWYSRCGVCNHGGDKGAGCELRFGHLREEGGHVGRDQRVGAHGGVRLCGTRCGNRNRNI